MTKCYRKKLVFLAIFAGTFSFLLGAANANSYSSRDYCNPWCDPCENDSSLSNCGASAGAEFLYWEARENNLDYVQDFIDFTSSPIIRGTLNYAQYDWHSGVRAWIGYRWGCDGWESNLAYTYFKTRGLNKTELEEEELSLGPTLANPILISSQFDVVVEAESKIKLKYQTLDFLLSRPFCMSQKLTLKPFFGFRALWLDRNLLASYEDDAENYVWVTWDSDFDGYGLHGGMDGQVNLCRFFGCGMLSMRGCLAGTLVVGEADVRNKQQTTVNTLEELNAKDKGNFIGVPGVHLGTGISWENCFECFHVLFNVGYEFNQYFNLPQVRRYYTPDAGNDPSQALACPSNNGNVLVHGLTVSAEVSF